VICVRVDSPSPVGKRESEFPDLRWTLGFRDISETAKRLQLGGLRRPTEI
jgi:hypothetical protein